MVKDLSVRKSRDFSLPRVSPQLAAKSWGRPQELPVLALHGWLDNAASFDELGPRLTGTQLVALDLPGHGLSAHISGCYYHFIDYLPPVLAAADALGWERFFLLGHSLGAAIASMVAAIAPERIQGLVLIEGLGPLSKPAASLPGCLRKAQQALALLADKTPANYATRTAAAKARQAAGDLSLDSALILSMRGTVKRGERIFWRSDPKLKLPTPAYLSETQVLACLAQITCPSLLIRARNGLLTERPEFTARLAALDALEICDLEGAHHLHLDDPEPSAAAVHAFLSRWLD